MKLSVINGHHFDPLTDRLYQPLRTALNNPFGPHSPRSLQTQLKRSFIPSKVDPHLLKQSTMFPQNLRLIQTNNPLKRMRVRSKSYKAISMEQKFKTPLNSTLFREQIMVHPPKTKEVVYDYDPEEYKDHRIIPKHYRSPQPVPTRTRSVTTMGTLIQRIEPENRGVTEKVLNKIATIGITSNNSIRNLPFITTNKNLVQLVQVKSEKQLRQNMPDFSSEYYQKCNKYNFNRAFKSNSRSNVPASNRLLSPQFIQERNRSSSNYKYNLFSMLDEQANLKCQTGFWTKNEIVAPKIRKKW